MTDRGILLTKGEGGRGCLGHGDRRDVTTPKIVEALLGDEVSDDNDSDDDSDDDDDDDSDDDSDDDLTIHLCVSRPPSLVDW